MIVFKILINRHVHAKVEKMMNTVPRAILKMKRKRMKITNRFLLKEKWKWKKKLKKMKFPFPHMKMNTWRIMQINKITLPVLYQTVVIILYKKS